MPTPGDMQHAASSNVGLASTVFGTGLSGKKLGTMSKETSVDVQRGHYLNNF